jgi:hypothetical protein
MKAIAMSCKHDAGAALKRAVVSALLLCAARPAMAQELAVLAGGMRSDEPRASSYGWLLAYERALGPHLSASFAYQNEGHVPSHHRDGHSAQLWARTRAFAPQLTLAAGIGPYRYFDTTVAENPLGYKDAHGWGVMYSVAATWRSTPASRWFYQLRVDRVETKGALDTTLAMAGIGYRPEQDGSMPGNWFSSGFRERNDELTLMAGQTIVNSFESQDSLARSLEYRRAFGPVLHGSIAWVNEGDARLIRRNGVLAQLWLEPSFYNDRFTVGLGLGPYLAVDDYHPAQRQAQVQAMISTTASYHFGRGWVGRISWHRVSSNYDRDSDIVLLGVGYRF